jgi:hypothetical protein
MLYEPKLCNIVHTMITHTKIKYFLKGKILLNVGM